MAYLIIKHLHSITRWFVLLFLLLTIIYLFMLLFQKKKLTQTARKLGLLTVIFAHIQLTTGIILYFISPKVIFSVNSFANPVLRFFLVEHITTMLIAISLITIGYAGLKKAVISSSHTRSPFYLFLSAFVLIMLAIPWPFLSYSGGLY